jgi:hypothetical protein
LFDEKSGRVPVKFSFARLISFKPDEFVKVIGMLPEKRFLPKFTITRGGDASNRGKGPERKLFSRSSMPREGRRLREAGTGPVNAFV